MSKSRLPSWHSIVWRLTGAFFAVSLLAIVVVGVGIRISAKVEFDRFLIQQRLSHVRGLADSAVAHYQQAGSWQGVGSLLQTDDSGTRRTGSGSGGVVTGVADAEGLLVLEYRGAASGSPAPPSELANGIPLLADGRQVGTLLWSVSGPERALERIFTGAVTRTGLWVALVGGLLAAGFGYLLARRLSVPLTRLAHATAHFHVGNPAADLPPAGKDEVGLLTRAFDQMSHRVAAEERLRRNLVADVAHELRTPVAIMKAHLDSIQDGAVDPGPEAYLPLIDETLRLSRLLDDLRSLSLAEAGQINLTLQPVSPGELIATAGSAFGPVAAASEIHLLVESEADLPPVQADRDRTLQVLHNLLSNALRHTPPSGIVRLSVQLAEFGAVRFTVADTGEGISPEDLPHIFERFYRAKRSGSSSGLGLTIARALVLAQGGRIWVESHPGRGAAFHFTFPTTS